VAAQEKTAHPLTLRNDARVLAECAEYFERRANGCGPCKGLGTIPETWNALRIRNHPPRVGSIVGVGFLWHDCQHCRQFRDLAEKCRGRAQ
jgi:hypothetical protein